MFCSGNIARECCDAVAVTFGVLSGMQKHESKKPNRPLPPVVSVAMLLGVRHVPLPSPSLHKGTSLCLVGLDHMFHTNPPMMCETQGSHNNLDFCKGHVGLSLSSDRVFDAGHPLGTCGSLCYRVQGSWVQILKLISFLTLLSRIILFLKVLEITSVYVL